MTDFEDMLDAGCQCSTTPVPPCSFCEPSADRYKALAQYYASLYHEEYNRRKRIELDLKKATSDEVRVLTMQLRDAREQLWPFLAREAQEKSQNRKKSAGFPGELALVFLR